MKNFAKFNEEPCTLKSLFTEIASCGPETVPKKDGR